MPKTHIKLGRRRKIQIHSRKTHIVNKKLIKSRKSHTKTKTPLKKKHTLSFIQSGGNNPILTIDFNKNTDLLIIYETGECTLLTIDTNIPTTITVKEYLFSLKFRHELKHIHIEKLNLYGATAPEVNTYSFEQPIGGVIPSNHITNLIKKYWIFMMIEGHKDKIILPHFNGRVIKTCITGCYIKQMILTITSYNVCALMSFGIQIYKLYRKNLSNLQDIADIDYEDIYIDSMHISYIDPTNTLNKKPIIHSYNPAIVQDNPKVYNLEYDKGKVKGIEQGLIIKDNSTNPDDIPLVNILLGDIQSMSYMSQNESNSKAVYTYKTSMSDETDEPDESKSRESINLVFNSKLNELDMDISGTITYFNKNHMNAILLKPLSYVCDIININEASVTQPAAFYVSKEFIKENILFILGGIEDYRSFNVCYIYDPNTKIVEKIKNFILTAPTFENLNKLETCKILFIKSVDSYVEYNVTQQMSMNDLIKNLFENLETQLMEPLLISNTVYSYAPSKEIMFHFNPTIFSNGSKILMFCIQLMYSLELPCDLSVHNFNYNNDSDSSENKYKYTLTLDCNRKAISITHITNQTTIINLSNINNINIVLERRTIPKKIKNFKLFVTIRIIEKNQAKVHDLTQPLSFNEDADGTYKTYNTYKTLSFITQLLKYMITIKGQTGLDPQAEQAKPTELFLTDTTESASKT
jgi:hypothetical protein